MVFLHAGQGYATLRGSIFCGRSAGHVVFELLLRPLLEVKNQWKNTDADEVVIKGEYVEQEAKPGAAECPVCQAVVAGDSNGHLDRCLGTGRMEGEREGRAAGGGRGEEEGRREAQEGLRAGRPGRGGARTELRPDQGWGGEGTKEEMPVSPSDHGLE
jgi:hypothetical protein